MDATVFSTARSQRRILLAGALASEVRPFIRRLRGRRTLSDRLVTGRVGEFQVGVVRVGVGRERAEARTRQALQVWDADWVISLGTCGALVDDLWMGQMVTGRHLLGGDPSTLRVMPVVRPVNLVTVDDVVDTQAARDQWAAGGAQVCDMEAVGVQAASGRRIFSVAKVVSDHAGRHRDPVFAGRFLPRATRLAIFQVRATALCEARLAPYLVGILRQPRH